MFQSSKIRSSELLRQMIWPSVGLAIMVAPSAGFAETEAQQIAPSQPAAPSPTVPGTESSVPIEEIIVSAKRTGVSVQGYAAAITALNANEIQTRQITSSQDLQQLIPSFNAGESGGFPKLFIRGIGQNGGTTGQDPAVVSYIDGVVVGRAIASYEEQFDLQTIEVLRGPQGTLFGRNAVAGTINYVSKDPTKDFGGEIAAGFGNLDSKTVRGIINVPLSDLLSVRFGVFHNERDGYVENPTTGHELDSYNATAGRLSVLYTPSDSFTASLKVDGSQSFEQGPVYLDLDTPTNVVICCGAVPGVDFTIADGRNVSNMSQHDENLVGTGRNNYGANLTLTWNLSDDLTVKSITGERGFQQNQTTGSFGTSVEFGGQPNIYPYGVSVNAHQDSEELDISGKSGIFNFVTGVYYYHEQANEADDVNFNKGFPPTFFPPAELLYYLYQDTDSYAAFTDVTANLTDELRLIGGIRYTEDSKTAAQLYQIKIPTFNLTEDSCAGGSPQTHSKTFEKLTWKGGVEYSVDPSGLIYGTVSKGFRSGGFSDFAVCGNTFAPELVTNYEIGFKERWFGGRLTTRLAGFVTDYSNLQVQRATIAGTVTENAGGARVKGIEAEAQANLTNTISVDGTGSWLQSEYTNYVSVYPLDPTATPTQLRGNPLIRAPKFSGTVGLNWTNQLSDGGVVDARVEGYFTSKYSFSAFAAEFSNFDVQQGYALANVYVTYTSPDELWKVNVFGKNLTNTFYVSDVLDLASTNSHLASPAVLRTFGFEVARKF